VSVAEALVDTEPRVVAERLERRYGRRTVVRDLNLRLVPGSVMGLVGPNGAGKTTLLSMLAGFIRPSSGTIAWSEPRSCGDVGVLPQSAGLHPDETPERFLTFAARLQGLPAPAEAARAMLSDLGLSGQVRRRARTLSPGEQRLVAIGQAFLGDPKVILLDEPTEALDPWGRVRLRRMVRAHQQRGAAILIASHNLVEVERMCDVVAVMADGRLITCGPLATLVAGASSLEQLLTDLVTDELSGSNRESCVRKGEEQ
jgi:ABC-2 type transport system ATP-binding protein